ncbi:universal stress protein [Gordonia neofelifaecis]|uniref:Universal stress protein n=1 Tax=Gordonia neofelifaecis NRRL B-59395 TaxID=644548 RepID=F1YPP3_9ACTN|nr:universal stress protein [Gordonia neofelifaecis]EGD53322.1 universal stress protein [Gordonia neofelifaecis NRRL B-59395]
MEQLDSAPIIVGIDGSRKALGAARWAAEWSTLTGHPIRLVYAVPDDAWFATHDPFGVFANPEADPIIKDTAEKILHEALTAVRDLAPLIDVVDETRGGTFADYVREHSAAAAAVVIGSTRSGHIRDAVLGSQVMGIIRSSSCPTLAWREYGSTADDDRNGVVVGYDSSPHADRALSRALEHARVLHEQVTVAYYFPVAAMIGAGYALNLVNWERIEKDGIDRIRHRIAPICDEFPEVDVDIVYGDTSAARGLVASSKSARLLVVGSRGRGAMAGTLLGSVSQNLVHHARCPVLVVP